MFKIAILGTESTHARSFCNLIYKGHPNLGNIPFSDFEVVGLLGDNPEENEILREITGGRAEISDDPNHWVGKVDAVMVTARHGDRHLPFARKYLECGTPAFIDKPVTINPDDAVELARIAKAHNAPICGGSSCGFVDDTRHLKSLAKSEKLGELIGGSVYSPIQMQSEYAGFYFYCSHLIQIMGEIFGYDIESIIATKREKTATFIAKYKDFDVTGHYGMGYIYSATVYGRSAVFHKEIDLSTDSYFTEFARFAHMVRYGKSLESLEEFIKPVFIAKAIDEAMETGKEVKVGTFTL